MLALLFIATVQAHIAGDWPAYGRDPGGARFSPLAQITRENVTRLQVAWTYHTGEPDMAAMPHRPPALEVTPLVVDGVMYLSTPPGHIVALDPATGVERWRFDAGVNPHRGYGDFASRGVSFWRDSRAAAGASCARRIIAATIDARLVALDAGTGKPCAGFGSDGVVDLRKGLRVAPDEFVFYEVTSPPAIVGDLIITGSAIDDQIAHDRWGRGHFVEHKLVRRDPQSLAQVDHPIRAEARARLSGAGVERHQPRIDRCRDDAP